MNNFVFFQSFFEIIDDFTRSFVNDVSTDVVSAITPIVAIGLNISFIIYGYLVMRGAVEMPMASFVAKSFRIAVITCIALTSGLYQTQLTDIILQTPDGLAQTVIPASSNSTTTASVVDDAIGEGLKQVSKAWEKAEFFSKQGIVFTVIGVIIFLAVMALGVVGGGVFIVAKVMLAIMAALGPLFIAALLFDSTKHYFNKWIAEIVNFTLIILMFTIVFLFFIRLLGQFFAEMNFDGMENVAYNLGGAILLAGAGVIVLLQIPKRAAAISSGFSLGISKEARQLSQIAGATSQAVGSGAGAVLQQARNAALIGHAGMQAGINSVRGMSLGSGRQQGEPRYPYHPGPTDITPYYQGNAWKNQSAVAKPHLSTGYTPLLPRK